MDSTRVHRQGLPPLSAKQQRVLTFIREHIRDCGYPPTVREIASQLGLAGPNSAKKYLDILQRKGYVRRTARSSRAIELIEPSGGAGDVRLVPVVGTIPAGTPLYAVESRQGTVAIDASLCRADGMFFLRIRGDSMKDAHIVDGDLALIRPQHSVEQGEIAAVRIGDEATVKYFYREKNNVRLQPAHDGMEPIIVDVCRSDVSIIGKVVSVFRVLE